MNSIPPSAVADELPLLNLEPLRDALGGDEAFLAHLLERFAKDLEQILPALDRATFEDDLSAARELVHKVKGSAGDLGAMRVRAASQSFEMELAQGVFLPASLDSFSKAVHSLRAALDARIG